MILRDKILLGVVIAVGIIGVFFIGFSNDNLKTYNNWEYSLRKDDSKSTGCELTPRSNRSYMMNMNMFGEDNKYNFNEHKSSMNSRNMWDDWKSKKTMHTYQKDSSKMSTDNYSKHSKKNMNTSVESLVIDEVDGKYKVNNRNSYKVFANTNSVVLILSNDTENLIELNFDGSIDSYLFEGNSNYVKVLPVNGLIELKPMQEVKVKFDLHNYQNSELNLFVKDQVLIEILNNN